MSTGAKVIAAASETSAFATMTYSFTATPAFLRSTPIDANDVAVLIVLVGGPGHGRRHSLAPQGDDVAGSQV